MSERAAERRSRGVPPFAALLAAAAVWLAVDAWLVGSLLRYRLVAWAMSAALAAPFVTTLLFGARARAAWRAAAFASVPLLVSLALAEGLYRWFAPARQVSAVVRADRELGHVLQPGTGCTDARGFRNAAALDAADVLFVGDSQTWGFAVEPEQAFSARVEAALGRSCYQMANGSYGPVQYLALARRGLELGPADVVVVLYFGNDLVDAVDYAGLPAAAEVRTQGRSYGVRALSAQRARRAPNLAMSFVDGVLGASMLLDAAADVLKSRLSGGMLDDQAGAVAFAHPTAATVLLPDYRRPALDLVSGAARDGLAVTARCCAAIAAACEARGARLLVATLPTKELCYVRFGALAQLDDARGVASLRALAASEADARAQLAAALDAEGVAHVDLLDPIVAAMAAGRRPWFASGDGHLSAVGHDVVGEVLAGALRR